MAKNKKGHPSTSRVIIFLMTVSSEIFVYVCMKKKERFKERKKGIFRSLQEEKRFISSTDMWERKIISKRFRVEKKKAWNMGIASNQQVNFWDNYQLYPFLCVPKIRSLGQGITFIFLLFFISLSISLTHFSVLNLVSKEVKDILKLAITIIGYII